MDDNLAQLNLRDILKICRTTIDKLNDNSIVAVLREQNDYFDKALDLVEELIPVADNVLDNDIPDIGIRAATMFLIGLWSKLKQGGSVSELNRDDWINILGIAVEQSVEVDPKDYTLWVFELYRRSIAFAIEPMRTIASPTAISRLEEIVSLMDGYAEELDTGAISEAKFIEENLWLSLEAVFVVMMSRMNYTLIPAYRQELAEAISAMVFQKFRYSLYEKELSVIDECLAYQSKLDQRLTEQVNVYIDALRDELDTFDLLVEKAFDTKDYRSAFRGSADLAKMMGGEGVLQTQQDIDDYFLS